MDFFCRIQLFRDRGCVSVSRPISLEIAANHICELIRDWKIKSSWRVSNHGPLGRNFYEATALSTRLAGPGSYSLYALHNLWMTPYDCSQYNFFNVIYSWWPQKFVQWKLGLIKFDTFNMGFDKQILETKSVWSPNCYGFHTQKTGRFPNRLKSVQKVWFSDTFFVSMQACARGHCVMRDE